MSPRDYEPVDHPPRHCIVCGKEFKPYRQDQIFCSWREDESCWRTLHNAERLREVDYHKALVRQRYTCVHCGSSDVTLRPHITTPDKLDDLGILDIAASCTPCRKKVYQLRSME